MPGLNGLDLQDALAQTDNPAAGHLPHRSWRHPYHRAGDAPGAEDFLTKRAPKEELLDAVRRALDRDARERDGAGRLREACVRASPRSPHANSRCCSTSCGKLNKKIACDLGIHERTVKLHRTAITTKMGVSSAAELTTLWMEAFPKGQ